MSYSINPFFQNFSSLSNKINSQTLAIFFLGIASGIPINILFSTVTLWLVNEGVDKFTIGLVSISTLPYLFKFSWAPFLNAIKIPYFSEKLGNRKALIIVLQSFLIIFITCLGFLNPTHHTYITFICLLVISIFSASQDIIMDTYRIELLTYAEQAIGSGSNLLGYKAGGFISNFIIPFLASYTAWQSSTVANWRLGFIFGAFCILSAWIALFFLKNPNTSTTCIPKSSNSDLLAAFSDFVSHKQWVYVFAFILTYRINHQFINSMEKIFWLEKGYTLPNVVGASHFIGLFSSLVGITLGTTAVYKLGLRYALALGIVLPLVTSVILIVIHHIEIKHIYWLYGFQSLNQFVNGLAGTVLVTYFDILSKASAYTATLYAFFSSLYTIGKIFLPIVAGYITCYYGWSDFFYISFLLGLLPLVFLFYLKKEW